MVWHAYLLNPRCFFEDCVRFGRMDFWALGMPWAYVDQVIDPHTFMYAPSERARSNFEKWTGCRWDNLDDHHERSMTCPKCVNPFNVPYTRGVVYAPELAEFTPGSGFADKHFRHDCSKCGLQISHDTLRVSKFIHDTEQLTKNDYPMPGTILEARDGYPPNGKHAVKMASECTFPNQMLNAGLDKRIHDGRYRSTLSTVDDIRKIFESAIKDRSLMRHAKSSLSSSLTGTQKVSIRRMMSRYWYNSSQFALDLVGAVIRQGSFVEKMHAIDWLHSPALANTMARCVQKYSCFFSIMKTYPTKVAVPTLDIDLAWHTNQCSPVGYMSLSDRYCKKLIDHDDKIEESKLSEAFAWTSRTYQNMFSEPYSECTCWYCEAVRESSTSSVGRLFSSGNVRATEKLHQKRGRNPLLCANEDPPSNPYASPHISAHNAVRDENADARARRLMTEAKLDKGFHAAVARARKDGRKPPTRDEYCYAYGWGFPIMPTGGGGGGYAPPYGVDPCITGGEDMYASHPCQVDTSTGAVGSCAAGTCGGMAAAGGGSCAGSAGGCGGGGAGGGGCGGGGGGGGGGGCGGGGGGG